MIRTIAIFAATILTPVACFGQGSMRSFWEATGRVLDAAIAPVAVAAGICFVAIIGWLLARDIIAWTSKRNEARMVAKQAKLREDQASIRRREAIVTVRGAKLLYRMALRLVSVGSTVDRVKRAYDEGFRPFWKGANFPPEMLPTIKDLVAKRGYSLNAT